jgi:hypothetical protein
LSAPYKILQRPPFPGPHHSVSPARCSRLGQLPSLTLRSPARTTQSAPLHWVSAEGHPPFNQAGRRAIIMSSSYRWQSRPRLEGRLQTVYLCKTAFGLTVPNCRIADVLAWSASGRAEFHEAAPTRQTDKIPENPRRFSAVLSLACSEPIGTTRSSRHRLLYIHVRRPPVGSPIRSDSTMMSVSSSRCRLPDTTNENGQPGMAGRGAHRVALNA